MLRWRRREAAGYGTDTPLRRLAGAGTSRCAGGRTGSRGGNGRGSGGGPSRRGKRGGRAQGLDAGAGEGWPLRRDNGAWAPPREGRPAWGRGRSAAAFARREPASPLSQLSARAGRAAPPAAIPATLGPFPEPLFQEGDFLCLPQDAAALGGWKRFPPHPPLSSRRGGAFISSARCPAEGSCPSPFTLKQVLLSSCPVRLRRMAASDSILSGPIFLSPLMVQWLSLAAPPPQCLVL